jgi:hypothetical protein
MILGLAMGKIQAYDIHPGLQHAVKNFLIAGGGAKSGDDFSFTLH